MANASSPTQTGRNRRNGSPKPRRGYYRAVTPEVAAEICRRIASGQTLLVVCGDSDMPDHDAIYDEMRRSPSFAEAIARARVESAHGLAMQVLEIADAAGPGDNPQLVKKPLRSAALAGRQIQRALLRQGGSHPQRRRLNRHAIGEDVSRGESGMGGWSRSPGARPAGGTDN